MTVRAHPDGFLLARKFAFGVKLHMVRLIVILSGRKQSSGASVAYSVAWPVCHQVTDDADMNLVHREVQASLCTAPACLQERK